MAAARAGVCSEEVAIDASGGVGGDQAATPVILNDRYYTNSRAVSGSETGLNWIQMRNTLLNSASGRKATLGSLADARDGSRADRDGVKICSGMVQVNRSIRKRGPSALASPRCRRAVSGICICIRQYSVEDGGLYQEQQKSFKICDGLFLAWSSVAVCYSNVNLSAPTAILFALLPLSAGRGVDGYEDELQRGTLMG